MPIFAALPIIAFAEEYQSPISCDTFSACAELILKAAVRLALPIAVIFIVYSGFLFVIAQGSEEKLKTAKSTLMWALVGLAIVVGAWALAVAFQDFFRGL